MKLTGELKKQVEKEETIAQAGMLNDGEMDQVAGGWAGTTIPTIFDGQSDHTCSCGEPKIYQSGRGWCCPKCEPKS